MSWIGEQIVGNLKALGPEFLPFTDAATPELPLRKLLRLSMFQVTVGHGRGAADRHAQPRHDCRTGCSGLAGRGDDLAAAAGRAVARRDRLPVRHASIGDWAGGACRSSGSAPCCSSAVWRSCHSRCSSCRATTQGPIIIGQVAAALAFLLVGAGLHTVQTCGLALATDLAPTESHPRVVALLCMMLMVGMVVSAVLFGFLLRNFSEFRLIQVIQGAACRDDDRQLDRALAAGSTRPESRGLQCCASEVHRLVADVHE